MERELAEAKEKYDFVRFTFIDIHGIGRCKTVPKPAFDKFFKNGAQFYVGSLGFGFKGEVDACDKVTGRQKATNCQPTGNLVARPVAGTLHPLPTVGDGKYNVGEVLCETFHAGTGLRQEENPRYIARKQLDRLRAMGYELYSSFELEFMLVHPETLKPLFSNIGEMFSCTTESRFDPILLDMMTRLRETGVGLETMQTEYCEGQFELVLEPQVGIEIADNVFLARNCIKDVAAKHGLKAVFMTQKGDVHGSVGLHYNHSLRRIGATGDGAYAFSDRAGELALSDVCRRWLAGLVRHFRATTPLCSPTFNCYRRVNKPWAPSNSDWGIDNRMAAYRVKNYSPAETFIESRLGSGSANPYLVLAATLAAGIDGLQNGLPCPRPVPSPTSTGDDVYADVQLTRVPLTLAEALRALEENDYIVRALGSDFVTWFTLLKEGEIKHLTGCDVSKNDPNMIARERQLYMDML